MSGWRIVDDGKGAPFVRRPPAQLRDERGFLSAANEVAWLSGECREPELQSNQQDEGAVADSRGPGQDHTIEEPHTDEW